MSVRNSAKNDVSLEVREYARNGINLPPSGDKRARTSSLHHMQRVLLVAPPVVVALVLFISWYMSTTYAHINGLILPAPGDVLASLISNLSSGLLLSNALVTVQESVSGFLLALIVALPLGYGLAKSRLIAAAVQPYLAAGQAIPAIVIAPLLVLWLGNGLITITILCILILLFPIVFTIFLVFHTISNTLTSPTLV